MKFLHSMVRVKNLDESLDFYVNKLGLVENRRKEYPDAKFTLVYLRDRETQAEVELTYNWEQEEGYTNGNNFGHLAFLVDDIYQMCEQLEKEGVQILRPPRDGYMAFIKSPDGISIELLQKDGPLEVKEPWKSRESVGTW
ncbi:VOC family protein [Halobacteriovorax sp. GB3]|uniref:VOC family protein n=1 Tax=Halobacteriovorax sp. GB3 TaxID=2719615 RepID=UPI00235E4748|nr:VOC family protein [Halobacteriovorax sp. GB3]MDD0852195.1 VOC family protein [Halobacteriovorax sp. GB3]